MAFLDFLSFSGQGSTTVKLQLIFGSEKKNEQKEMSKLHITPLNIVIFVLVPDYVNPLISFVFNFNIPTQTPSNCCLSFSLMWGGKISNESSKSLCFKLEFQVKNFKILIIED